MNRINVSKDGKEIPSFLLSLSGAYTSQDASRTNVQPDRDNFLRGNNALVQA